MTKQPQSFIDYLNNKCFELHKIYPPDKSDFFDYWLDGVHLDYYITYAKEWAKANGKRIRGVSRLTDKASLMTYLKNVE